LQGREARLYDAYTQTYTTIHPSQKTAIDFAVSNVQSAVSNRFCIVFSGDRNTLPVKVTQFSAIRKSADVLLSWKTEQEIMIDRYVIEKSLDGTHFMGIHEIAAKNISGVQSYQYTDIKAGESKLFYRIRIIESTQAYNFTQTVSVSGNTNTASLEVFPNPVTEHTIHLFPTGIKVGTYVCTIYDMGGKAIFSGNIKYDGKKQIDISIPQNISTGMYRLVLQSGTNNPLQVSLQIR